MTVVCDTSPLIVLAKTGRLELLSVLYEAVWVPHSVLAEVKVQDRPDTEAIQRWSHEDARVSVHQPADSSLRGVPEELGAGERAAIALALERDADWVILDDREGRRMARAKGVRVTGTIGVLVEARAGGHIDSLRAELDRVVEAGLWISEAFYDRLIQEFDESSGE